MPYRYSTNVSDWSTYRSNPSTIPRCTTTSTKNTRKSIYSGTPIPYTDKACVANVYNAGNYYSFPAATAGSDNHTISSEKDSPNSICPKGWQLPSNSGDKSYQRLIRDVYQIADGPSGSADSNLLNNSVVSFVRLGSYNYSYGSLTSRGNNGYYWSATAYSSAYGHSLRFASGYLNPQYGHARAHGFAIRCVSR